MEGNVMKEKELMELQSMCFRMEAVLRSARELMPEEEGEADRAFLLLQTGRMILWEMTNIVGDALDFGRIEKPDDL